ncbi:chromosome segregation SMC family protein [Ureaplasma parvum]|uniref:Chromosome partition protein Smc n=3 Tax=Ureaplasma parvum TaxID=134821 RepID=Q9PR04_UREPA|nr:chromosome segregation SMC family protein [Ureaplasma parvum]pir/C82930/ p115 protein UU140 [imported] - Ureaplasma urealyticum [Ureaplasma urealyticum]AAF30546.1 p115 protein [Ureaplasma parvum serovar 3 str. ATCC 700970]ACA32904.1 p115 protein [Ureaplasma parvum serovar 3 str. ATCC 27815]ASD29853.1 hypothetical protein CEG42_01215 [Ureaplasma parvum]EDT48848.1 p115 protein [Ureaplasma parvum serovar 1 str. ATCC 27813]EDT87588.1 p115 protein [Ureaplasma parvum serovar 14 str. ATCC 33697]
MIFLKKIEAHGFKSFGEPVVIEFKHPMTGIIGANGTGKSNIIDALKWVIGDQSLKSMRAHKNDLLFSGGRYAPKAHIARVNLYFNNVNNVLYTQHKEIKISRVLNIKTNENTYYINDEVALLKDITDMFLDSGLSKGSLGIISQGAVSWFAEAKPNERRKMFEEASGIGRYSKRKQEALNSLSRANENLARLNDIVANLKKELAKLQKQAMRFNEYKQIKDELTKLDLVIIVRDIIHWQKQLNDIQENLKEYKKEYNKQKPLIQSKKNEIESLRVISDRYAKEYTNLEFEYKKLEDTINDLNLKLSLTKNTLETTAFNATNTQERIDAFATLIKTTEIELNNNKKNINEKKDQLKDIQKQKLELESLKTKQKNNLDTIIWEIASKNLKKEMLEEQFKRQTENERGVKTIIDSQKALVGVYGTVAQNISTKTEHELAISTALAKGINNIIVKNNQAAENCINFLKKNNAGVATFLPIENLQAKSIKPEFYDVLKELEGFVGVANELVKINVNYKISIDYLLGNTIIANNLKNAIILSEYTYKNYKVVSLEGDIVFGGGAISGGSNSKKNIILNLEEKIKELDLKIKKLNEEQIELNNLHNQTKKQWQEYYNSEQIINGILNNLITTNNSLSDNLNNYKSQYEALSATKLSKEEIESKISDNWNEYNKKKNELINLKQKIQTLKANLNTANLNKNELEITYNKELEDFYNLDKNITSCESNIDNLNYSIQNVQTRLVDNYKLSVENAIETYQNQEIDMSESAARLRIESLKIDLEKYNDINLNALEEYEEKQAEYDSNFLEYENCKQAVDQISSSIQELDKKAKADFMRVIRETNKLMPEIFEYLFGGGSCAISLNDPNNILESGVEIIANPPGKRDVPLSALSGGEKTMVVLAVLFALLKIAKFPLVILDEAEAALDASNVAKFGAIIAKYSDETQFLVITHREGTMKSCGYLLGTTMMNNGVTTLLEVDLNDTKIKYESEL